MSSNAAAIHEKKIHTAMRSLENADGTAIKEGKIGEWALLEIAQQLRSISYLMAQQNARGLQFRDK